MITAKDWLSFFVGLAVLSMGLLPLLNKLQVGPPWFALTFLPVKLFAYFAAGFGFYLVINSIIEITNSNGIGWMSFLVAGLITALGVLNVLGEFGVVSGFWAMTFLTQSIFHVLFVVLGLGLVIATFAMEL